MSDILTRRAVRAALFVLALGALAACDVETPMPTAASVSAEPAATSRAASEIYREQLDVPYAFVLFAPCANDGQGEVLQTGGTMRLKGQWVASANGARHYAYRVTFEGSAVGWETGDVYDVASRELAQGSTTDGDDGILDSGQELLRTRARLTSRATGASFDVTIVGHWVLTPAGEWAVDQLEGTARC